MVGVLGNASHPAWVNGSGVHNASKVDPVGEALLRLLDALDASIDPGTAIVLTVGVPIAVCALLCCCICCRRLSRHVRERGFKRMITCGALEPTPKRGLTPDVALETHQDELAEVDSVDEALDSRSPPQSEPEVEEEEEEAQKEGGSPEEQHAVKVGEALLNGDAPEEPETEGAPTPRRPLVKTKWNEPAATGVRTPNGKAKAKPKDGTVRVAFKEP